MNCGVIRSRWIFSFISQQKSGVILRRQDLQLKTYSSANLIPLNWSTRAGGPTFLHVSPGRYSFAHQRMRDEGYRTAWGLYHMIYDSKGYWFRTPEAWDVNGNFRASMYMRPAAIWAMEMISQPQAETQPATPPTPRNNDGANKYSYAAQ